MRCAFLTLAVVYVRVIHFGQEVRHNLDASKVCGARKNNLPVMDLQSVFDHRYVTCRFFKAIFRYVSDLTIFDISAYIIHHNTIIGSMHIFF